jgi:hypothetical protein
MKANGSACSSGGGSSLPSYYLQQNLQVTATLTKDFMDKVMRSDLAGVRKEQERIGIPASYLIDEKLNQNAIFFASLNKSEEKAL